MHILIVNNTRIPVSEYGGIERIIWWLGKELTRRGHKVTYLVAPGSSAPFAECLAYDPARPVNEQVPNNVDFVHLNFQVNEQINKPYLISHHTNYHPSGEYDINTVFSSQNHAQRNDSRCYVYNGVDINEYSPVDFNRRRKDLLFMAYAKRPEKNLKDCKWIARKSRKTLAVIGLKNKWFRRLQPYVSCKGFLGGAARDEIIQNSQALLFPVRWHEPFGIAMIECMYYGLPVFGSPYGSLPEIVGPDVGFLSNSRSELAAALRRLPEFNPTRCHQYVCDQFTSKHMTDKYLEFYEKVLNGESLNPRKPKNGENFDPQKLLPFYP